MSFLNYPESIELETGDVLPITGYSDGKFFIGGSPTIEGYFIRAKSFTTIKNGLEVPYGITAKDPQFYIDWLNEHENV